MRSTKLTTAALFMFLALLLVGCQDLKARQPDAEVSLTAAAVGDLVVPDLVLGGVVWASDMTMVLPSDVVSVFLPTGLATDGERLWVGDWVTGIVWQLEFDGRNVGMPGFEGFPPTWWIDGVAVGPSGAIYVSENGRNVLTRIWPR